MARRTLSDTMVAKLKAKASRYNYADPQLPGHYVRVMPTGAKSFAVVTRDPNGKQVWHTIGRTTLHGIAEARELAREAIKRIKAGEDRSGPQTFASVAEDWLKRHVQAKGLRSENHIRRCLARHVMPAWGHRDIASIKRRDVAALLDQIEDSGGPVMADKVLAFVSGITNWYATRNDDYVSPVRRGMRRSSTKERARERILSDGEIRTVWKHAAEHGVFGALVRLLLLTGQRREKVASIRWQDVSVDGVWTIPSAPREKGNAQELVLPEAALAVIRSCPRLASNPYVIAGRTVGPLRNYYTGKRRFDAAVKFDKPWTLHDLRRTARSLMARAGVRPDISERVLGHVIHGVEGTYDRHSYRDEKAHALRALAGLVENILRPPPDKVVALR
jgi:integrase